MYLDQIEDRLETFADWLGVQGAIIEPPTNEFEVLRFKTVNGVSVIYRKSSGRLTFTHESWQAWELFDQKKQWKITDRKRKNLRHLKEKLASRDGKACIFSGRPLPFPKLTIEHLLSKVHGGTDNINNLALACEPCNMHVGKMSVAKKLSFAFRQRAIGKCIDEV